MTLFLEGLIRWTLSTQMDRDLIAVQKGSSSMFYFELIWLDERDINRGTRDSHKHRSCVWASVKGD